MYDQPPKIKTDSLRTDITDMYELEPADRYSFIRTLMENGELYALPVYTQRKGVVCHYIRDMKTADGHGSTEVSSPEVFQAGNDLFTRLKQCEVLEVDTREHRPYVWANLSECSLLIARDEQRLWAAHLGMSQVSQLEHALERFHQAGFQRADCEVIASVGEVQEANNNAGCSPRLDSRQAYIEYGFKPDSITTFEYIPPTSPDDRLHRNFCEVIIGADGQLITTFDAESYFQQGMMHESIDPATVKEVFIAA